MPKGGPEWLAGGGAGTDGPYLLSPYTHNPSKLARSLARALLPKNSPVPESREFSPRRILYKRQGVGTRGAGAGEGGARTEPPAGCSKRRARQGRADVSLRLAKPRRAQRRAGKRSGRASPGPSWAGRAGWCRRSGLAPSAAEIEAHRAPHPVPVSPSAPSTCRPRSAARARARRHLHFGDSAVGKCLHRTLESQSGKSATPRLRPAAQVETAGLSGQGEGRAGIWVSLGQSETDRGGCHLPPPLPHAGPSS